MIENNSCNSSQESLPMSQETAAALFEMLNAPINDLMLQENAQDWRNVQVPAVAPAYLDSVESMNEMISRCQASQLINPVGGSLPAVSNWPGKYSFRVFFNTQEPIGKKAPWAFSSSCNKLYVTRNSPCPINFATSEPMNKGVFIRATAVFSEPKNVKEVVTRCLNHEIEDQLIKNIPEVAHLIRCESALSHYGVDFLSKRQSVRVPYENPPVGQEFSTYLYKFTCYSSCVGGPNRRPTTLVFTLEDGNNVIGRQSIGLKICACPSRDKKNDETPKTPDACAGTVPSPDPGPGPGPCPKKPKMSIDNSLAAISEIAQLMNVKSSEEEPRRKKLYVKAADEGMYNFLLSMKKLYCMQQTVNRIRTSDHPAALTMSQFLYLWRTSSDEDTDRA